MTRDALVELREALSNLAREMRHMLAANPEKDGGLYRQCLTEAEAALSRTDSPASEDAIHNAAVRAQMSELQTRIDAVDDELEPTVPMLVADQKAFNKAALALMVSSRALLKVLRQEKETI